MTKLYIAYGSNMDMDQMAYRCPQATLLGTGEVRDYRLLFKGSKSGNYATIEPQEGRVVPVLVWKITRADEASLDRYEGCPIFYYKTELPVTVDGQLQQGLVYIMHEERRLGLPKQDYYGRIAAAYEQFGFDKGVLAKALADTEAGLDA